MPRNQREWQDPRRDQWRCTIEGCPIYMVWQTVPPGTVHNPGEHYDREHAHGDRGLTPDQVAAQRLRDIQRYAQANREQALAAQRAANTRRSA